MFIDTNEADNGWREDAREFVKFWGPMVIYAVFLQLIVFAYFANEDLKKAESTAAYWKGQAGVRSQTYCPPRCIYREVAP